MTHRATACAALTLHLFVFTALAHAATTSVTLVATDMGRYNDTGTHAAGNTNYLAGWCIAADCGGADQTSRNFFTFDLNTVTDEPVAATLRITMPASGVSTADADETYELFEVTTAVGPLTAGGVGLVLFYTDLGDGLSYGSTTIVEADEGTFVEIPLNAAGLAAIGAAAGGDFAIGGAVTSLVSGATSEFVFGFTLVGVVELVLEFNATDNYKCYKTKDLKNPAFAAVAGLSLADQFGPDPAVSVSKPFLLCAPADEAATGIIDPVTHLCCYKIKGTTLSPAVQATVTSGFGNLDVEVKKPQVLCKPCTKALLP